MIRPSNEFVLESYRRLADRHNQIPIWGEEVSYASPDEKRDICENLFSKCMDTFAYSVILELIPDTTIGPIIHEDNQYADLDDFRKTIESGKRFCEVVFGAKTAYDQQQSVSG